MPYLFCIVCHGSKIGIRSIERVIHDKYPDALVVSAYHNRGKVEICADPELLEAYTTSLEMSKAARSMTTLRLKTSLDSQMTEVSIPLFEKAEPFVLDSEEHYWQFVSWIRTRERLMSSQVVAYIESNVTDMGSAEIHPKAIHHANHLNPGVIVFFTGTKACREQTWAWIEHNGYSKHPRLKRNDFKDCLASPLSQNTIEKLPALTVTPRPLFAVIDKDKHAASVGLVILPTLLERFCCFKTSSARRRSINAKKVKPVVEMRQVFSNIDESNLEFQHPV